MITMNITENQATLYNDASFCLRDAMSFYTNLPKPVLTEIRNVEREARQDRIDMSGPATDSTIDYLSNHLHRLSSDNIRAEIEALDAQIAVLSPMDYAWAEATLYDLQGTRMVLEDALAKLEREGE